MPAAAARRAWQAVNAPNVSVRNSWADGRPSSTQGKHLLAHELTHTLQQGTSPTGIQRTMLPTYPWSGVIIARWSAALRRTPEKDPANPHVNTLADLRRGASVRVIGNSGNWLQVEADVDGTVQTGYVSQELVGACCACVTSAAIENEADLRNGDLYGHDFDFNIEMEYKAAPEGVIPDDPELVWDERSTRSPAWQGLTANTWNDMFALFPSWLGHDRQNARCFPIRIVPGSALM